MGPSQDDGRPRRHGKLIVPQFVSAPSPNMARAGAGGHPCQGLWYSAENSRKVAFIATHYDIDFSEHYLAEYLARRGHGFLGWNTRFRGMGHYFTLEQAVVDIGVGVRWLREEAGIDTVVLLGNSGGASLMSAYQSQAIEPNITATRGSSVPDAALDLPPADLFVSLNAHPGRPDVLTMWLDPSVTDESDPLSVDPTLDMHNPEHAVPYSKEFIDRYRRAQEERNHRITAWCIDELRRLSDAGALRPGVQRVPHLGRSAVCRPGDRSLRPGGGVLFRRLQGGQLPALRVGDHQYAAGLAVDVEPLRVPVPGPAPSRPDHPAVPGHPIQ